MCVAHFRICAIGQVDIDGIVQLKRILGESGSGFFKLGGLGVFQGELNQPSSKSVTETYVLSVLLHGSKNCALMDISPG